MKRLIFWLLVFTSVIGAFACFRLVLNSRKTIPAAVPLYEPPRAPFAKSIGGRGLVESVNENVRISPAVAVLSVVHLLHIAKVDLLLNPAPGGLVCHASSISQLLYRAFTALFQRVQHLQSVQGHHA